MILARGKERKGKGSLMISYPACTKRIRVTIEWKGKGRERKAIALGLGKSKQTANFDFSFDKVSKVRRRPLETSGSVRPPRNQLPPCLQWHPGGRKGKESLLMMVQSYPPPSLHVIPQLCPVGGASVTLVRPLQLHRLTSCHSNSSSSTLE